MAKAIKAANADTSVEAEAADKPKRVRKTATTEATADAAKPKRASRAKAADAGSAQAPEPTAAGETGKPAAKPRAKPQTAGTAGSNTASKPRFRKAAAGAAVSAASTEAEASAFAPAASTSSADVAAEPQSDSSSVINEAAAPAEKPVTAAKAGGTQAKPKAKTAKAASEASPKTATKPRTRKGATSEDGAAPDVVVSTVSNAGVTANAVIEEDNTSSSSTSDPSETVSPPSDSAPVDQVAQPEPPQGVAPKSASAEKPWLASYPPNVPPTIPGLPADSLGDMMVNASKRYAGRIAFSCMGRDMKFVELEEASAAFGAYLQAQGLAKGARVALMMPNVLQYPIALMGALRAGYTVVNVNPLYTARELEHQLKDADAEAIVILENFAHTLQSVVGNTPVKHIVVASLGDLLGLKGFAVNLVVRRIKKMVPKWTLKGHIGFNAALKAGRSVKLKPVAVTAQDLAFLQYTGGTTGISKGAALSHANVLANIAQNAAWLESAYIKRTRPDRPVFVCALPLYHIYALTVNALMGMQQGAQNVLITNPRDIPAFVKELRRTKFHIMPGLNTLFNALLNNKDFQKLDFSSLVLTFGGGMAVQRAVAERWKALTGTTIAEGYGLSETSPVAVANRFDAEEFSGTIGLPLPSTEVSIRDESGVEVPLGETGEICIRGPQVMTGYWKRPDETANVMTADGFLKSGDIGFMNKEGYTKIVDRKKDMILVSGFNVYPNEIEDVVARHPKVLEVAVVGVLDEKSGEVPKLFVVKKDQSLDEEELRNFCRENLTGYKRPRHFEFRNELPKTAVGKILRRDLRD
jgi:long-chain acyl-CoA synthetase